MQRHMEAERGGMGCRLAVEAVLERVVVEGLEEAVVVRRQSAR